MITIKKLTAIMLSLAFFLIFSVAATNLAAAAGQLQTQTPAHLQTKDRLQTHTTAPLQTRDRLQIQTPAALQTKGQIRLHTTTPQVPAGCRR